MSQLTPELAAAIVEALPENAEEAAGALGRAFDGEYVIKAGEPTTADSVRPKGPGLTMAFKFGEETIFATLPAAGGMVPDWVKSPDPTGESKLSTLSQELSMLLVPDTLMADGFESAWSEDLSAALDRSGVAGEATAMPIEVAHGETLALLTLYWPAFWPAPALDAAVEAAEAPPAESEPAETAAEPGETNASSGPDGGKSKRLRWNGPSPRDYRDLPPHILSALRVSVPVSVNLAGKKLPLQDVVELGPGSIITFDKSCDDPLEVTVGTHAVATGEAVKVGERFGVRVKEMILPDEHFRPMLPPTPGD